MTTRGTAPRRPAWKAAVANEAIETGRTPGSVGILLRTLLASALAAISLAGCADALQGQPGVPPNAYIHQLSLEGGGG